MTDIFAVLTLCGCRIQDVESGNHDPECSSSPCTCTYIKGGTHLLRASNCPFHDESYGTFICLADMTPDLSRVHCQHPSCIQTFESMEAMNDHFDRSHA